MVDWLIDSFPIDWVVCRLIDWLIGNLLTDWFLAWLIDWLKSFGLSLWTCFLLRLTWPAKSGTFGVKSAILAFKRDATGTRALQSHKMSPTWTFNMSMPAMATMTLSPANAFRVAAESMVIARNRRKTTGKTLWNLFLCQRLRLLRKLHLTVP